jgi:hypothetical protein
VYASELGLSFQNHQEGQRGGGGGGYGGGTSTINHPIPSQHVGVVIGKGGETIKSLQVLVIFGSRISMFKRKKEINFFGGARKDAFEFACVAMIVLNTH